MLDPNWKPVPAGVVDKAWKVIARESPGILDGQVPVPVAEDARNLFAYLQGSLRQRLALGVLIELHFAGQLPGAPHFTSEDFEFMLERGELWVRRVR